MLEVSILRSPSKADPQRGFDVGLFPTSGGGGGGSDCDDFMGVDDNLNLLEYIDFSCCDVPFFDADGDILPDLEVDPTDELLAEFSSSPETTSPAAEHAEPPPDVKQLQGQQVVGEEEEKAAEHINNKQRGVVLDDQDEKKAAGETRSNKNSKKGGDEGSSAVTTEEEDSAGAAGSDNTKSSASAKKKSSKDSNGKRKVDWTPELHRRFVQAVEQLGIDKAVPSRILEIMGIECLTRHNIASHLQKYRSHRKHLMAREAEAASWAQKRHSMYAAAGAPGRKQVAVDAAAAGRPWVVPTIGFPPPPPFCRPLHVWGHPPAAAVAEARVPPPAMMWPRQLAPTMDPAAAAAAYWNQQYNATSIRKWGPHHQAALAVTTCPMPPPAMVQQLPCRFPAHPTMFRPTSMVVVPPPATTTTASNCKQQLHELQLQLHAHPSKESIDAAIGDVLVKPWLPLPLGLKPPSLHSVMSELHKQGIPKVPPAASTD
ncbi:unnamed protein product [Urochloa decumbens]|uniref:HTH myb-type domain-containing protein n=1 Tax=Urochloa decumbens TaxID=240449 RepID=A0ABC9GQR4_9POAL